MSDETGKCKKANQSLDAIHEQVKSTEKQMVKVYNILMAIDHAKKKNIAAKAEIAKLVRIDIPKEDINLYMDFCLLSDDNSIEGAIIYGALRDPLYPYSLWPNPEGKKEEKPLLSFSVDDLGKISSEGKLEDEWWLTGNNCCGLFKGRD